MTPQELKTQLHALADVRGNINPRADFVHQTREHLIDTLQHTVSDAPAKRFRVEHVWEALSVIVPSGAVYSVVRPAVMMVLVFGLATGTWITGAFASLDSKSGELLYPVKIGIEKTTETVVGITQGEAAKTKVKAENLSRRVEEAKALVAEAAENGSDVTERVDKTLDRFKKDIAEVSQSLADLQSADIVAAIDVAKVVDETSEKIVEILDDTQETIVSHNTMIPEEVTVIVAEAASVTAETEMKTVDVYLETLATSGEEVISKEEVKQVIDKKIERIERAVVAAQEDAKSASEFAQSTPETLHVEQVRIIEPTKEIEVKSGEVQEAIEEAKELLNTEDSDFTEVVKRVQELTPLTQEVKQKVAEVEKAVEEISAEQAVSEVEQVDEVETEQGDETSSSTTDVELFDPNALTVEESEVQIVE